VKAAAGSHRTHNPFEEACRASRVRENLMLGSYGEGLKTDQRQALRQFFTRQWGRARSVGIADAAWTGSFLWYDDTELRAYDK
jgi:hypothetical protein